MSNAPKRTRSARSGACSSCVKKKIRCYIGVKGIPCMNCRGSNLTCDGGSGRSTRTRMQDDRPSFTYCSDGVFASQIQEAAQTQFSRERAILSVAGNDSLNNYLSIIHEVLGQEPRQSAISFSLPPYVADLPSRLELADLQYLKGKSALSLPSMSLRTQLIQSYILWVHPHLPFLNLEAFLSAMTGKNSDNKISLLLLHAVMFAGSYFADVRVIHSEGYLSRNEARNVLLRRVKALLELHCEDDRLVTVQVLLLLVHSTGVGRGREDAKHWMGICLSLAVSLGLHRNPDVAMGQCQQMMRRRTWWSIYNHARLVAPDLLPMMGVEDDLHGEEFTPCEPTIITIDDFPIGAVSPEAQAVVGDLDILGNIEHQKSQALVFIEVTRLCRLSEFPTLSSEIKRLVLRHDCVESWPFSIKINARPRSNMERLQEWFSQLPSVVSYQYPVAFTPTASERSIYLRRAWLKLFYLGSAYAAHCNQVQFAHETHFGTKEQAYEAMRQYLDDITDLFQEIDSLGLLGHLPSSCTVLILMALAFHRQEVDESVQCVQAERARRLHQCWNMMHQMSERSELADYIRTLPIGNEGIQLWKQLSAALLLG